MAQLLVQVVSVNTLAAGATVTIPHTLESNGVAVVPTLTIPDRSTSIVVQAVSTTGVTFRNDGALTASANFRLERGWQPEVDAFTVTPLLWNGGGSAVAGRPVVQVAALAAVTTGISSGVAGPTALPTTFTVPANVYTTGSTVRARIAGTFIVGQNNTTCNITLRANGGTILAEFTTAPLAVASYVFCADMMGVIETGGKAHGSTEVALNSTGVINFNTGSNGAINTAIANNLYAEVTFASGAGFAGTSLTLNTCTFDLVA